LRRAEIRPEPPDQKAKQEEHGEIEKLSPIFRKLDALFASFLETDLPARPATKAAMYMLAAAASDASTHSSGSATTPNWTNGSAIQSRRRAAGWWPSSRVPGSAYPGRKDPTPTEARSLGNRTPWNI
jgi:hypothetical protein